MILKVFSVYDIKACCYMQPFFMSQKGQALRSFSDLVNDSKSTVSKHPSDYKLFMLGEFDDESGVVESLKVPEYMASANDFVEPINCGA